MFACLAVSVLPLFFSAFILSPVSLPAPCYFLFFILLVVWLLSTFFSASLFTAFSRYLFSEATKSPTGGEFYLAVLFVSSVKLCFYFLFVVTTLIYLFILTSDSLIVYYYHHIYSVDRWPLL